ncbi:MAG: primary-amine oxidase [Chloroflexota bacterium]
MTSQITHPLDPLTVGEMQQAAALIRASKQFAKTMRFVALHLAEPEKEGVLAYRHGEPVVRRAEAILLDNADGATYELLVDLAQELVTFKHVAGVQPALLWDELVECETLVRNDPQVRAALQKRGITKMEWVQVDPAAPGHYGDPLEESHRFARALLNYLPEGSDNLDAHPIDGLHVLIDLNRMAVIRVEDEEVIPVPLELGNFSSQNLDNYRQDLRPLDIVQPDGVSFEVEGWQVRWQKWSFRVSFNYREGLVLHQIGYEDGGRKRPIIYRASLAEMTVPYADTSVTQYRKNFLDAGEYGMGVMTNSLQLGCDCLGEIYYFDGHLCRANGDIITIPNAICLHEEDFGMLWKHGSEVRRSRRLVISFVATVGNYDYGFYWYFYQDGSIQYEVKLTGVVATGAVHAGQRSPYGTMLSEQLYAPNHQHFFCVRLDMTVDDIANSVAEMNSVAVPTGENNPYGNAFYLEATPLTTETDAQRVINPFSARYWQILNPNQRNKTGEPVGYKLLPGDNVLPFASPESSVAKRSGYMWKHLWVTPYEANERYPAGEYPNQHPGGAGLPGWTAENRSIENRDLVVWYVMGNSHVVRLEDWPVMPVVNLGFRLKPSGFFDQNPALDVPPNLASDHCHI